MFATSINSGSENKIDTLEWHACHNTQTSYLDRPVIPEESFIERDRIFERKVGAVFHPSVTMNGKTFRGDYGDPNQMFKAICSFIGKNKPEICRELNFNHGKSQDDRDSEVRAFDYEDKDDMAEAKRQFDDYEKTLQGMEQRAKGAEIVLGLLTVFIVNCICF